jgi:hypothetical protein
MHTRQMDYKKSFLWALSDEQGEGSRRMGALSLTGKE